MAEIRKIMGVLTLGCALGAAPGAALAGAWANPPGEGLLILASTYDFADRSFDASGAPSEDISYDKSEISVFGEYGLFRGVTLVGRAALQDVTIENAGTIDTKQGLAATELGVRGLILQREADVLSVQTTLVVPGSVENVSDLRLGDGGFDYEARILYGRSLRVFDADGFAEAQAGWRKRSGAPPDEARLDLTVGWRKGPWGAMAQAFGLYATGATPPRRNYANLKLQASVMRDVGQGASIQIGAFRTMAGRQIVQETALFVAVWRRF